MKKSPFSYFGALETGLSILVPIARKKNREKKVLSPREKS